MTKDNPWMRGSPNSGSGLDRVEGSMLLRIRSESPMSTISICRLCNSPSLKRVFSLGEMVFSGVFPSSRDEKVPTGELTIVLCGDCSLAQLDRDFPSEEMYGDNYGYMSSLNSSMVEHLKGIAESLEIDAKLEQGDVVLDIGSNDGTLLSLYQTPGLVRVGMDPTIVKYKDLYPDDVITVADFFSKTSFAGACPGKKANLITTIAMLYDLPDPAGFAKEIRDVLADDGFWHIEVSYGPWMLDTGAFDAVCHEHVEYYSLKTLKKILDGAGFKISAISFNETNGGSISITSTPIENELAGEVSDQLNEILDKEARSYSNELSGWAKFDRLAKSRIAELEYFLTSEASEGKRIVALGASTKGNVLLQSLSTSAISSIEMIGEVNEFKFGRVTPGTHIGIVPEDKLIDTRPDFILVLPWHFKKAFKTRLAGYVNDGGRIVFPLPELEIVSSENV